MSTQTLQISDDDKVIWICKRCGEQNKNKYECAGTIKIIPFNGELYSYYIGCRNTLLHNKIVSKYCFSKDRKKKKLGVNNYKEYVRRYGT